MFDYRTNSTPLVAITIINLDDSVGKKYVDAIASNILGGSETFQGDINMNSHRIKNVHTPTTNNDAVNKAFCETTYRKKWS